MKDSRVIVASNKEPQAPTLQVAELFDAVPALVAAT